MSVKHEDSEFVSHDNTVLRYQAWIPENPEFIVLYLHGAGAHSGEATTYAEFINKNGNGALFAPDLRGWGKSSERKAGHFTNTQDVIDDILTFLDFIKVTYNQYGDLPFVLAGHSMGGLIALRVLIDHQDEFTCATISSPWIATRIEVPAYVKIFSGLLSKIWPTFSDDMKIKFDELTHDNKIITKYYKERDEGLRRTHGTVGWFVEITKMQKHVSENAMYITLPIIILQAGQDLVVKEAAAKDIYNGLGGENEVTEWQYYPNYYHELWNETDRETTTLPQTLSFIEKYVK